MLVPLITLFRKKGQFATALLLRQERDDENERKPYTGDNLRLLALRKVFFFRLNNQPIFDPTRKIFRVLPKHAERSSRHHVVKRGKFYAIEVKSETGRMSDHQLQMAKAVVIAGGEYVIARSIDDVQGAGL